MASSRNEHLRFRYGVCLNDGCSKCKSKEVQQIPARKELVCAECGKPLRECRRPQTWWEKNGKKVIGGTATVVVLGVGGLLASGVLSGDEAKKEQKEYKRPIKAGNAKPVERVKKNKEGATAVAEAKPDTTPVAVPEPQPEVKPEPQPKDGGNTVQNGMGTINLSYGKYVGDIRNGKPDGAGVLTYTKAQQVVSTKDIVAQPGERIEGVFDNGKPTLVTLYKKDGNTIKIKR